MNTQHILDLEITGPNHTRALALALAPLLQAGDVLILTGELGAGKTTFTRSLGEGLGVREGVISPTFVLSRVHPNLAEGPRPGGPDLVHVDAYRLASAEELDDLDLEYSLDRSVT
ncbi:MAG: tRNA (adenosine(37)-N6)-threonylcarbamoyltransferase complex ATPase subunit type 1 TsaE, partial [Rothia sp. (in: high G+C Gram-positive bacteria)]|nr:tRNA (adenosine(37)-N6)-threonylcarbamoyltransferase complex ATPase subunit type 1 TsaE [Rothia sp. (in: high G+C Gram-positive bacteria)]